MPGTELRGWVQGFKARLSNSLNPMENKQASNNKNNNKQTKSLTLISLRHCKPKLTNDFFGHEKVFWNWIVMMGAQHRTHTKANGLHILCKYYIIYILAHKCKCNHYCNIYIIYMVCKRAQYN